MSKKRSRKPKGGKRKRITSKHRFKKRSKHRIQQVVLDKTVKNISPKVTIALHNINGNITVHTSNKEEIAVKVVKRGNNQRALNAVKINHNLNKKHVFIKTIQPKNLNDTVEVTYKLTVPKGAKISHANTVNGTVVINGIQGSIETKTVNGNITCVGIKNSVKAFSTNGSVVLEFSSKPKKKQKTIIAKTVNGSITVAIPKNISALINASTTMGSIDSDLPLIYDKHRFIGAKARSRLGNAKNKISLQTTHGRISITT